MISDKICPEMVLSSTTETMSSTIFLLEIYFLMIYLAPILVISLNAIFVSSSPLIIFYILFLASAFTLGNVIYHIYGIGGKCLRSVTKNTPYSEKKGQLCSKFNLLNHSTIVIDRVSSSSARISFTFSNYLLGSFLYFKKCP